METGMAAVHFPCCRPTRNASVMLGRGLTKIRQWRLCSDAYVITLAVALCIWTVGVLHKDMTVRRKHSAGIEDIQYQTQSMQICIEKCKHNYLMCQGLYSYSFYPVPTCLEWTTTLGQDVYWRNETNSKNRNANTRELIRRYSMYKSCTSIPFSYDMPMMYPDEFEMITKTMVNARPRIYLEWGGGKSTSFYPHLAKTTYVIDGYPPWCSRIAKDLHVKCTRVNFHCMYLQKGDVKLEQEGRLPRETPPSTVRAIASVYVNAIDTLGLGSDKIDFALVDGRFRVACVLKLLPFIHDNSIVVMHDFWLRKVYHVVLKYYNVIGHTRSLVFMRRKAMKPGWHLLYKKYMTLHEFML